MLLYSPSCEHYQVELECEGIKYEAFFMTKKTAHPLVTKTPLFRTVASSTAIETGVFVEKIEQQLKRFQAQAKSLVWLASH